MHMVHRLLWLVCSVALQPCLAIARCPLALLYLHMPAELCIVLLGMRCSYVSDPRRPLHAGLSAMRGRHSSSPWAGVPGARWVMVHSRARWRRS